jgi:hypothetical protein
LCAAVGLTRSALDAQLPPSGQIHHTRGQNVAPVYEGWYKTADGGIRVSFGYLNRNYEETPDIPLGPNNKIEPGPADQGQPTHFVPRRQYGVFVVALPKDRPKTEVTWTLSVSGRTESVPSNLSDLYVIDALKQIGGTSDGNTPPVLRFEPAGMSGVGPSGVTTTLKTLGTNPVTLDVWVADEKQVKPPDESALASRLQPGRSGPQAALRVTWSEYRGPGAVHFSDPEPPIAQGKASTTATFTEPGEYMLRVAAFHGAGFAGQCCWTNGYAKVSVGSPAPSR